MNTSQDTQQTTIYRSDFDGQPFVGFEKRIDGKLTVVGLISLDDGKIKFKGDFDESARLFFKEFESLLLQELTNQRVRTLKQVRAMINDGKRYTWIDVEGMNLLKEITSDITVLISEQEYELWEAQRQRLSQLFPEKEDHSE